MKFKKEMLLPEAEPFTNACTNKELIDTLTEVYMQAGTSKCPKDKYTNRRSAIVTAVVSLLNKTTDLQIYEHTFGILYDYLKQFDEDFEEVE